MKMYRHKKKHGNKRNRLLSKEHHEEYSTEFTPTGTMYDYDYDSKSNARVIGLTIGYTALFFSLFSLFLLPVLFGLIGIVLGIYTVSKGQSTLGYTAIGFGLFSVIISIFYNLIFVLSAIF